MRSLYDSRYKLLLRRLRAARRDARLTQQDVAKAVGRPQSFVSKCEAGERRIDAVELLELARLYGKHVGYFVAEGEGVAGASLSSEGAAGRGHGRRGKGRRSR
jgi:transcriptional regulator with XRE-family HTH domain